MKAYLVVAALLIGLSSLQASAEDNPFRTWCEGQYPGDWTLIEKCAEDQRNYASLIIHTAELVSADSELLNIIERCGRDATDETGYFDTEVTYACMLREVEAYKRLHDGKAPWTMR